MQFQMLKCCHHILVLQLPLAHPVPSLNQKISTSDGRIVQGVIYLGTLLCSPLDNTSDIRKHIVLLS